jgi:CHAD domain-containing protein
MKKKDESKYLNKHWKKMQNGLKTYLKTGDKEQLHTLRVEVKKLRAMLTLMQTITRNKKLLKLFKPVKTVFKHAGEIRNSQINLELAQQYQLHNEEFEYSQRQHMEQCAEEFKQKAPEYIKKLKRANHRIKSSLRRVPDKSVAGFYKNQLKQIAGSLAIPHFDEGLHDCRKQMKILMYNYGLSEKALQNRVDFNEPYIDDLQSHIGNWHDHILAIELFASPEIQDGPVMSKIKRENRKTEKNITELTRDFMYKATTPTEDTAEPAVVS